MGIKFPTALAPTDDEGAPLENSLPEEAEYPPEEELELLEESSDTSST
jgi:hypothetical protein